MSSSSESVSAIPILRDRNKRDGVKRVPSLFGTSENVYVKKESDIRRSAVELVIGWRHLCPGYLSLVWLVLLCARNAGWREGTRSTKSRRSLPTRHFEDITNVAVRHTCQRLQYVDYIDCRVRVWYRRNNTKLYGPRWALENYARGVGQTKVDMPSVCSVFCYSLCAWHQEN